MTDDRDAWAKYAEREGLIKADDERCTCPRFYHGSVPTSAYGCAVHFPNKAAPTNKFHAVPVHIDGIRFASTKEAARFLELRLMEKTGLIADLETQPLFPLHIFALWRSQLPIQIVTVGVYRADFRYIDLKTGEIVIEDTKSPATRTEAYVLRKKLVEVIHGVHIREL